MGNKDQRIDDYISKAAPFARPVLTYLRKLVHKGCPGVEETIKWGMPFFEYKGTLCHIASFKEHCAFGFWKATLMKDAEKLKGNQAGSMGHLGRITSLDTLPDDKILLNYIKEAMQLNEEGIKLAPRKKETSKKEITVPAYFIKAISKNKKASTIFEAFPPSHKNEYLQWIIEAKSEETRNRRMDTAIEWIAEGKGRNWKYVKK